ncbi:MAG TPA: DUF3788 domain-containing protein [Candidatus Borkfalkia excrementipullorum]|nr:DUF3788 domain-containing protein [Candidatus Borkfalkia excrementipullorum]
MNSYEDEQKLINLLGQALYTVWSELCKAIDAVYEMEHIWNNGGKAWKCEYKFRKGGKTLCALYAQENRMGFLMIFGKDERAKFEAARNDYSGYIQNIYDNAKTYHDGKWILFEPVDCSLFDEFLRLLAIKRKPNKK